MADDDLIDEAPSARTARPASAPKTRTDAVRTEPVRRRVRGSKSEDHFYIPDKLCAMLRAKGLSWEFKRLTYFGKEEDPDYHIALAENGWEPLSLSSFPEFKTLMPKNWTKDTFEKRGQQLMVRPQQLTDEARAEDKLAAEGQVKGHLASLKDASHGEAPRLSPKVKRSYEGGVPVE